MEGSFTYLGSRTRFARPVLSAILLLSLPHYLQRTSPRPCSLQDNLPSLASLAPPFRRHGCQPRFGRRFLPYRSRPSTCHGQAGRQGQKDRAKQDSRFRRWLDRPHARSSSAQTKGTRPRRNSLPTRNSSPALGPVTATDSLYPSGNRLEI